ncbi:PHD finger protein 10-like isoform X1 [Haliotis cracherodii]|uniref:PHD finger protein 10-like isoform X1 n=1 Tax=Haliotis cracherodii TaxID=6455 RepID=UPI0039E928DD
MASFSESDAKTERLIADTSEGETALAAAQDYHHVDVPIQQTEQSKDDNTTQKQSTSKESEIEPATEKKSAADSSQMKGSTPLAILGNIVDYPITPESSEDDQEVDSVSLVNKEKETEAQAQNEENTCEDTKPDSVEGQQSKEESVEHSVEPNQETSVADKVSESIETTETSEEVSAGDTVSKYVNSDSDSHETEPAKDDKSGSKDDSEKVSESTEQTPSCEKEEEKESETKSSSVHADNEVDDIEEVLLVEEPVERRKAGPELETETAVDDAETASQGSAEFQPQIDEKTESEVMDDTKNEVSLVPESEGKSDIDKETLLDTKPECMDVDGEESNQDVTMETEAVAAPAAGTDAEDGDSLLPDTDGEVKRPVSKPSSFPITEAFLDENSLSLDCVLAISSTVPEGETSVDISLGGSINAYSKDSKDCPTPAKRSRPGSVMSGVEPDPDLDDDGNFPAESLFEYQWPLDGGEWYMLQEQISEYLQIKSFKRKYPDLYRRTCDKNEKDFLRERGVVSETQSDLGLTALRSEEVYDLMHKDYSEKYREYAHVLHEKERQTINNKHKEYEVPKLDKGKMGAYIKKAVKAAADFNAQFQRERREERRAYFDLQTFMVHYPAGRYKKLPPEATKPDAYPVPLIPGQFQDYYCKYTADELRYLPINTAKFDPPKKVSNTLVKPSSDPDSSEVEDSTEDKVGSASEADSDGDASSDSDGSESEAEETKEEPLAEPLPEEKCRICNSTDPPPPEKKVPRRKKVKQEKLAADDQEMIKCSECGTVGHPSCLDLTNAMVSVIRTYPWQCMECKTCVECMDPYDEDKMMFCDRCDRGYHTFCVGLRSIPTGRWECRSCKGTDTPRSRKRTTTAK